MATSIIWTAIPPLQTTPWGGALLSVIMQEYCRFIFFIIYEKVERSFSVVSTNAIAFPLVDFWSALAAGTGWGFVQTLVMLGPLLTESMGYGSLFTDKCPSLSVLVISSWTSLFYNMNHIAWMLLALQAYRSKSMTGLLAVSVLHVVASSSGLMNDMFLNGCLTALPMLFAVTAVSCTFNTSAFKLLIGSIVESVFLCNDQSLSCFNMHAISCYYVD
jgi:hypothetical protein